MANRSLMNHRQQLGLLILNMTTVSLIVAGVSISILYRTSFKEQEQRLQEIAQSQARLIEAIIKEENLVTKSPNQDYSKIIRILKDSDQNIIHFKTTEEFTVGKRQGNQIIFILSHSHQHLGQHSPIPWESNLAEPTRKALMGESGILIGLDYKGNQVLAAYQPVASLNWGLVVKIDLAEIRSPFLKAGIYTIIIAIIIDILGAWLFFSISQPIIRQIEKSESQKQAILDSAADGILTINSQGIIETVNQSGAKIFNYNQVEIIGKDIEFLIPSFRQSLNFQIFFEYLTSENLTQNIPPSCRCEIIGHRQDQMALCLDISIAAVLEDHHKLLTLIIRDVTERKEMQLAIKKERDFINKIIETVESLIIVLDTEGRIVSFNQACEKITHYQAKEVLNLKFWDLFLIPEEIEPVKALFTQLKKGNFPSKNENYWLSKEGERILISWSDTVLINPQGEIEYIIGTGIDITERRKAETSLKKLNEELEIIIEERTEALHREVNILSHIMETSPVGILLINSEGQILLANGQIEKIFGLTREEITQHNYYDPQWHFIDYEGNVLADEKRIFSKVKTTQQPVYNQRHAIDLFNGDRVFLNINGAPLLNNDNEFEGGVFTFEDVTEIRQFEEALRTSEELHRVVLSSISDAVFITDNNGNFIFICPNVFRIFGYDLEEVKKMGNIHKLLGKNLFNINQLKEKGEIINLEREITDKNAKSRYLLINIKSVAIQKGTVLISCHDITERKQAEIVKAQLTLRNQSLVQALGEIVYQHFVEENLIYWDGNYTEVLGYSLEEIGHDEASWLNRVNSDDVEQVLAEFNRAFTDDHIYDLEYRLQHKDGSYVWVHDRGVMYGEKNGKPEQVIGVMRNITNRKQAEIALQESENRYRRMIETVNEGILIIDENNITTFVNEITAQMLGYDQEEMLGKAIFDFMEAEEKKLAVENIKRLRQGFSDRFDFKLIRKDGQYIWTIVSTTPIFDLDGNFKGYLGLMTDITERKQMEDAIKESELKFRSIFEKAALGLAICNMDGKFVQVNQNLCKILGYLEEELLGKRSFENIIYTKNRPEYRQSIADLLQGQINQYFSENRCLHKDGSIIWVKLMVSVMQHYDQEILSLIYAVEDISDRKKAELALQESETKFRTFIQTAGTIIIVLSSDYKILEWNQEAEQVYGYSREEVLQQDYLILCLAPKQRNIVIENFTKVLKGEAIRNFELLIQTSDASERCILWNANRLVNRDNEPIGIIICGQDITERKNTESALTNSEQRFRTLADFTYDWEYWFAPDGHLIYISPSCERITEYTPNEFYQDSQLISRIVYPEDQLLFADHYCHSLTEHQTQNLDFRIISKTGKIVWIAHTCRPVYAEDGRWLGRRVSNRDISDRKQAEQQLQQVNQKLQESITYLEQQNQDMELLEKLHDFLQACFTTQEAYNSLGDIIKPLFPQCSGTIFMVNPSKTFLESVSNWGEYNHSETIFTTQECWALRKGGVYYTDNSRPSLFCKHTQSKFHPVASLCLPMMAQGEAIGLLYITSEKLEDLNPIKQQLARNVAEHLSQSLANLRLWEELQNQSIRDPLTGLFNRRYLEESLEREIYNAQRKEKPLSVIMIDIDHFKNFNDTFGHDIGDAVLKELGNFLKTHIRAGDIACRYGGEELTLILPDADLNNTQQRAEAIRQGIKTLNISQKGRSIGQITASFGVACFPQHGATGSEVIRAADKALYRAKQEGRDRVILAPV